ncbi:MAG: D-lactate dehydrogenase (Cytochrome) [Candidatus Jettenia ecosi]|uniref:D-lactate dehydrogenase (cytochrome) n=1 Tax=Candidatus Jettenia ecosi TaxID=2494326 RepID=A0A533Q7F2_9BACT|nr:MAG: D-lactate dehydrogenase (Cytochrome) [Candidatus Jettenia ecosi]
MLRSTDPDIIHPYLKDASNLNGGYAQEVVFPENETEVIRILEEASCTRTPVTISGNGTGLVGARIPFGGIVLSTEKLGGLRGVYQADSNSGYIITGPALTLKGLQEAASANGLLYPPDPTEQNAFIGASVATNASGARTFKYGATRTWVRRLKVVLVTGDILELRRGEFPADSEDHIFLNGSRNIFELKLPHYRSPNIKHSAGYYITPEMSALDLFIGSEGTLGVFTEVEVELILKPYGFFSGIVFLNQEEDAWHLADQAREESLKNRVSQTKDQFDASVLEYFDSHALHILRTAYPQIPPQAQSAVFFEQEILPHSKKKLTEQWFRLFQNHQVLLDQSWFSESSQEHTEFRVFRHAIPALVNKLLRQHHQMKIGTDFTVPKEHFFDLLRLYRQTLKDSGLRYCTFGHIADNHLHVNILPQNDHEAQRGWQLYSQIADIIIRWGGSISAEHGVGKIKRNYLLNMVGHSGIMEMACIKKKLDPYGILGRGTIIPEEFLNT